MTIYDPHYVPVNSLNLDRAAIVAELEKPIPRDREKICSLLEPYVRYRAILAEEKQRGIRNGTYNPSFGHTNYFSAGMEAIDKIAKSKTHYRGEEVFSYIDKRISWAFSDVTKAANIPKRGANIAHVELNKKSFDDSDKTPMDIIAARSSFCAVEPVDIERLKKRAKYRLTPTEYDLWERSLVFDENPREAAAAIQAATGRPVRSISTMLMEARKKLASDPVFRNLADEIVGAGYLQDSVVGRY